MGFVSVVLGFLASLCYYLADVLYGCLRFGVVDGAYKAVFHLLHRLSMLLQLYSSIEHIRWLDRELKYR